MDKSRRRGRRLWLGPIFVLAVVALFVFAGFYLLDFFTSGEGERVQGAFGHYLDFDAQMVTDSVPALAALMAAVLGIVITVVSIIVQLSADRYTGVAQMFLRDRVNIGVMAYFVIACVFGVWLSMSLRSHFLPRSAVLAMMAATTVGLVLMLPYFAYVFWFLEPGNIIARIRSQAVHRVVTAARNSRADHQNDVVAAMEELSDITSNSVSGKDKIIASRAVDALKDFTLQYVAVKADASPTWFTIGDDLRGNPDFVAMDPESLRDLEERKIWVEWKVLRQYLGIYNECMEAMPDINYLIAIDTRYVAEAAAQRDDRALVQLCYHFMNSYIRSTLNAGNVRTAYNVLNQYRKMISAFLVRGLGDVALEGVGYLNYYGQVSYDMKLTFVTETAAYDIAALCEQAHAAAVDEHDDMLQRFLELDQPMRVKKQEKGLLGVRKAQTKLAAYYLEAGEEDKARMIADDMRDEPQERLQTIWKQLRRVESKDFWEIIDRGRNFEYMAPDRRARMETFFSWLGVKLSDSD